MATSKAASALKQIAAALEAAESDIEAAATDALVEAARSEAASRGWSAGSQAAIQRVGSSVVLNSPQSSVETGRGPITAAQGSALRIRLPGGNIFRKSVGPQSPEPLLVPSAEKHSSELAEAAADVVKERLKL